MSLNKAFWQLLEIEPLSLIFFKLSALNFQVVVFGLLITILIEIEEIVNIVLVISSQKNLCKTYTKNKIFNWKKEKNFPESLDTKYQQKSHR